MFIGTESFQLLVQYLRLLYGDSLVKSAGMTHQTVCKAMMTEVLAILVSIILVCFGGMQQSQAEGVVVRFVPTVFAVIQDRHTIVSTTVSQIGPILCIDFIGSLRIVAPLHASKSQIVSSFRICYVQGEFGLQ